MTRARYIRSTARSLNQYIPKFMSAANTKKRMAPFWPPRKPPNTTSRAVRPAIITKIFWATWHRTLGKLAMDVLGPESEIAAEAPYDLTKLQRMYLFTRSDTIYAGSNQIQRNIISERVLEMPREPR